MIRVINNPELAPRNQFHVARAAARLIEFDRTEDLQELFEKGMPDPWYVLGGGNNVLFTQDYPGTLLTPVAQGIRIVDEQPDCVTVEADAGVEWDGPGRMGRTARTVGIGKPLAHPRQSRGRSGSEYRGLRLRGQGCDPKRRDVLHGDLQHARPEQRTLRVRVPGQRLQTLPAGTCNHHLGPLLR